MAQAATPSPQDKRSSSTSPHPGFIPSGCSQEGFFSSPSTCQHGFGGDQLGQSPPRDIATQESLQGTAEEHGAVPLPQEVTAKPSHEGRGGGAPLVLHLLDAFLQGKH